MKKLGIFTLLVITVLSLFSFSACSNSNGSDIKTSYTFSVSHSEATLEEGETLQLTAKCGTLDITYSSSDEQVASVSASGLITAKKTGSADIIVTAGSQKIMCRVNVVEYEYTVTLSVLSNQVFLNANCVITAKTFVDGSEYKDDLTWSVNKEEGCKLQVKDGQAVFTASKVGEYVVTAESSKGGVSTITITVIDSIDDLN